jgi:sulfite exporter TauE/SafE
MCGPIALAIPINNTSTFTRLISILIYNSGRVITYSVLGAIFGFLGQSFVLFGLQQILSVTLGVIILLSVILPRRIFSGFSFTSKLSFLFGKLKSALSDMFKKRSLMALFNIGLLNGLLPCGLIYIAIAGAIASGSIINGTVFMAVFGLGTIPAMFTVSLFSHLINVKFRSSVTKVVPYMVSFMAVLLILRGLNLGIPYISPEVVTKTSIDSTTTEKELECCHKPD